MDRPAPQGLLCGSRRAETPLDKKTGWCADVNKNGTREKEKGIIQTMENDDGNISVEEAEITVMSLYSLHCGGKLRQCLPGASRFGANMAQNRQDNGVELLLIGQS